METKVCSKCGIEKHDTNEFFTKDPKSKNGLSNRCKICANQYAKEYKKNNLEKAKASNLSSQKKHRQKRTEQQKDWRIKNREKTSQYSKKYNSKNTDKVKSYRNEYTKKRYKEDILFRLNMIMRSQIHRYFDKDNGTIDYLGCSIEFFKSYIESQFNNGMTWENQGRLENVWGWELDHIIPASTAKTEDELYKLYHYSNFQPLWKKENLIKSDKIGVVVQW